MKFGDHVERYKRGLTNPEEFRQERFAAIETDKPARNFLRVALRQMLDGAAGAINERYGLYDERKDE